MEDWHIKEEGDTASTSFYPSRSQSPLRQVTQPSSADKDTIQSLEEHALKTKITIDSNWAELKRLQSKEELRSYIRDTEQQLTLLHNKNQGELAVTRDLFDKGLAQLERQASSTRKEWKDLKQKYETQLEESLLELKAEKTQNETTISSLLKNTTAQIKGKFATFGKEMKEFKNRRVEKTNNIMQQIDTLRENLEVKIQTEHRKRIQYDSILLGLLNQTCDQGERLLRRIL